MSLNLLETSSLISTPETSFYPLTISSEVSSLKPFRWKPHFLILIFSGVRKTDRCAPCSPLPHCFPSIVQKSLLCGSAPSYHPSSHIHIGTYIHTHTQIDIHVYIYTQTCIHTCIHTHMFPPAPKCPHPFRAQAPFTLRPAFLSILWTVIIPSGFNLLPVSTLRGPPTPALASSQNMKSLLKLTF